MSIPVLNTIHRIDAEKTALFSFTRGRLTMGIKAKPLVSTTFKFVSDLSFDFHRPYILQHHTYKQSICVRLIQKEWVSDEHGIRVDSWKYKFQTKPFIASEVWLDANPDTWTPDSRLGYIHEPAVWRIKRKKNSR